MNEDYSKVALIIPAYEPDEKLIDLLESLREKNIKRILLVDDGSGEDYAALFEKAKETAECEFFRNVVNLGKGRTLKNAFNLCLNIWPDLVGVVTADSDGQHIADDIVKVMQALQAEPDKLILGVRDFSGKQAGIPARSLTGNRITSGVFRLLLGLKISDTQTGLRGIGKDFMKRLLTVSGEKYEFETNMLIETRELQMTIREVPIQTVYIGKNVTSHFRPVRDTLKICLLFLKYMLSSCTSSAIDLTLFGIFCSIFRGRDLPISYIWLSTILARIVSATCNYFINLKIVFATEKSRASIKSSLWKFILLALWTMAASGFLVQVICPYFSSVNELLIKIPVDVGLFLVNFVIQREVVYRKK